jgi:hypothetical protein
MPQELLQLQRSLKMARPTKTIRTIFKNIGIPEDLVARMELELYSEIEGRIPFGAQQEFFTKLLREYFDGKTD